MLTTLDSNINSINDKTEQESIKVQQSTQQRHCSAFHGEGVNYSELQEDNGVGGHTCKN